MNLKELKIFIESNPELSPHKSYLEALIKPSVDISLSDEAPLAHESRFGGLPIVPDSFIWPTHEKGHYDFLGQINFSEIPNSPEPLPKKGLLSLFFAYDEEGEIFWQDEGYIIAYFWEELDTLSLIKGRTAYAETKKIDLSSGVEIPRHPDLRTDWPFDTDILYDLDTLSSFGSDYLLGYPSYASLAYDPTPQPTNDWVSLLTITSHDEFAWCWHDGDKLMVFIEKSRLLNKDFSHLKSDAG